MPTALGIGYSFLLGTGETASGVLGSIFCSSDGQTEVSPAEGGQSTCHSRRLWGLCSLQSEEETVKGGPDRCFWLAAGWLYGRRKQTLSLYMPKKNERQQKQVTTNGWKFQLGIRNSFSNKDVQTLEQVVQRGGGIFIIGDTPNLSGSSVT